MPGFVSIFNQSALANFFFFSNDQVQVEGGGGMYVDT